jgi:hypothetical protein
MQNYIYISVLTLLVVIIGSIAYMRPPTLEEFNLTSNQWCDMHANCKHLSHKIYCPDKCNKGVKLDPWWCEKFGNCSLSTHKKHCFNKCGGVENNPKYHAYDWKNPATYPKTKGSDDNYKNYCIWGMKRNFCNTKPFKQACKDEC